mgnify:CR=1 FL=1
MMTYPQKERYDINDRSHPDAAVAGWLPVGQGTDP